VRDEPFHERRRLLEELFTPTGGAGRVHVTPATRDRDVAADWFRRFEGAGLDGVVAKASDLAYVAGKRVMVKVKHERTAEFVVGGFRWYKAASAEGAEEVGSLLLGLYDDAGDLAHVGVIGAFPAEQRRQLVEVLAPYRVTGDQAQQEGHPWAAWAATPEASSIRLPGARSRWNATKDLSFQALRPTLVVEAAYEHLQGHRLRHTAQFRRWRPDRDPRSCTYEQLDVAVPVELASVFGAGVLSGEAGGPAPGVG